MKLSRISRIIRMLTTLQSGRGCSADDLTRVAGVSRRTVFRDLKELSSVGVPFHFDAHLGVYTIEPEFFLPSIDLNLEEALSLLILIYKAQEHIPMPLKSPALMAGLKVESNLPTKTQRYCNANLQNIHIKPDPYTPTDLLDITFSKLQNAIQKRRKIRLRYSSLYDRDDITTILSPYHLTYNKRAWYVIGYSSTHKNIHTFKLSLIKGLELLDEHFTNNKRFDAHEYLGNAWSIKPEGKIYNVRLRFSPKVAESVAEVQWHFSQKTSWGSDGSLIVDFCVDGLREISWWILSYGDQVEVLYPTKLRKRIARSAERIVELNCPETK